jgi:hypothetical protein
VFRRRRSSPPISPASDGPVAQLAEQQTLNLRVEGSIPSRLTTFRRKSDDLGAGQRRSLACNARLIPFKSVPSVAFSQLESSQSRLAGW